jgi:non-specific serine/threonine protein kinase
VLGSAGLTTTAHITPSGTPHPGDEEPRVHDAFARGAGHGLLELGLSFVDAPLQPELAFLRDLGREFVTRLAAVADLEETRAAAAVPSPGDLLDRLAAAVPPMPGAEYVTTELLERWWREMEAAARETLAAVEGPVQAWLRAKHPLWNLVGRVCFHLAENPGDPQHPFAFLATFATRVRAKVVHKPLVRALEESSERKDRAALLSLLVPVDRAAARSAFIAELQRTGDLYQSLAWTPAEAHRFLRAIPDLEAAGVAVRVPDWWRARRPPRAEVSVTIGGTPPPSGRLDAQSLLAFDVGVSVDGEPLTAAEARALLAAEGTLVRLRGRWVELDRERLAQVLAHWKKVKAEARAGLSFLEGMRLLAGARLDEPAPAPAEAAPERVVPGEWLAQTLAALRAPEELPDLQPGPGLRAELRPYQQVGVRWLWMATRLGLGVCLADDMGLGKTVQVLALMELHRRRRQEGEPPHLLVVPASLLGNWQAELRRFTPELRAHVVHPSGDGLEPPPAAADVAITTYAMVARLPWLAERRWSLLVLDEAQAIKNPGARQSRAVKRLQGRARVALTGTPVENRVGDLWSLFDFLDPGLLGTARQLDVLLERSEGYAPLRRLVAPYLLRRLKTDRRVAADLPERTELKAYCGLAPRQAALYQKAVDDLRADLAAGGDGIERRGRVLAALVRFKQICNHPAQLLGDESWAPAESGKLARLGEIAETIAARQEKVLVFTQFREACEPLAARLAEVFGRPGLVLHGATPVARRPELVRRFQEDEELPFFVLSVRAGGTGLNLTAASHVVHFDRWWNPAVENQATDRAHRIGQTRNVLVHKLICRGTIEERIDALIESKKELAAELFAGGVEALLTEMRDDELLAMVALDPRRATEE